MSMKLKADPYSVFKSDDSPIALYARRRWMGGGSRDDRAAQRAVERMRRAQGADGSWGGSVAATIERLFALWLLGGRDDGTLKAINWLLQVDRPVMKYPCNDGTSYDGLLFGMGRGDCEALRHLRGVPFTVGCSGFVKTGAALFLATVLEQGDPPRLGVAYRGLARVVKARGGRWCSASCSNNMLQAFAVHPRYAASSEMRLATAWLAQRQKPNGSWDGGIPFYPTLYALSRVRVRQADGQFGRALDFALRRQNPDGSWGRTQRALCTFLTLSAMENRGLEV